MNFDEKFRILFQELAEYFDSTPHNMRIPAEGFVEVLCLDKLIYESTLERLGTLYDIHLVNMDQYRGWYLFRIFPDNDNEVN